MAQRTILIDQLEAIFRTRSSGQWATILSQAGVPFSRVNDIPTALAHEQTAAREMVQTVNHPTTGPIKLVGPVPKLSATPATIRSAPPLLGEQTEQVLGELLGYSTSEIQELRTDGVI